MGRVLDPPKHSTLSLSTEWKYSIGSEGNFGVGRMQEISAWGKGDGSWPLKRCPGRLCLFARGESPESIAAVAMDRQTMLANSQNFILIPLSLLRKFRRGEKGENFGVVEKENFGVGWESDPRSGWISLGENRQLAVVYALQYFLANGLSHRSSTIIINPLNH